MKKWFILLGISLLFSSCVPHAFFNYQLYKVEKHEEKVLTDFNVIDGTFENDLFSIKMTVNDSKKGFSLDFYNKSTEIIEIVWDKSIIILIDSTCKKAYMEKSNTEKKI